MAPNEIEMICDWLKRIETKVDTLLGETHHASIWSAVNGLKRMVYIGWGVGIALAFALPLIVPLIWKR
ncbi:MAG: hypothetical protein ACYC55_00315 [Candidatus Geothermincolia bacterium]